MDCKKVIFVHLPKTGGTLIREYFNFVSASQDVEIQLGGNGITKSGVGAHGPIEDFIDKEQAYKFGLVRNTFILLKRVLPKAAYQLKMIVVYMDMIFAVNFPPSNHIFYME